MFIAIAQKSDSWFNHSFLFSQGISRIRIKSNEGCEDLENNFLRSVSQCKVCTEYLTRWKRTIPHENLRACNIYPQSLETV